MKNIAWHFIQYYCKKFCKYRPSKHNFDNYPLFAVDHGTAHGDVPDEMAWKRVAQVLHRLGNKTDRVFIRNELHRAALSVEREPLHLEVAEPFDGESFFVADHVRGAVKEISIV